MNDTIVWVSETGLTVHLTEKGYLLKDTLSDTNIQLCDSLNALKRILDDIEFNPFKLGDKVRVKGYDGKYTDGAFDTIYHIAPNGKMGVQFYEDNRFSGIGYTWKDLIAYQKD